MKTLQRLIFGFLLASLCTVGIAFGASFEPEDHYAELNGVRLHYVSAGSGKLMIFLHGFPEFWYQWKPQLAEFSADFQAVAPDLRGFNLSAKPAGVEAYRVKTVVEDIRALADHLGQKKIVLVGQDWGGGIAWAFALYHPEYVDKLVILNAPHPALFDRELKENPAQQFASQYALVMRGAEAEARLSTDNFEPLLGSVLGGEKDLPSYAADRAAYLESWNRPGGLSSAINYYRASGIGPPDAAHGLPAVGNYTPELESTIVRVPTLVIWGLKDTSVLTGNLSGIHAYVPDLEVRFIPNGTHWISRENSADVNKLIRRFVQASGAK